MAIAAAGAAIVAVLLTSAAMADEPMFNYAYTTDILPQGAWEFEQWVTGRLNKSRGDYQLFQFRQEIEYGVTNDFQLALYANSSYINARRNGVDGSTGGPHVPENADPSRGFSKYDFDSFSVEGIYRLLSPYKDGFGLALYVEPAFGPNEYEMEYRVIAHKNFFEDQLVWAANLVFEHEWERRTGNPPETRPRFERESAIEFQTGLSYRLAAGWFAGLEFRNRNQFDGSLFEKANASAFFAGPNVHYAAQRFWVTLSVLPQLPIAQAYSAEAKDVRVDGRVYGDFFEKLEVRLRAGWRF